MSTSTKPFLKWAGGKQQLLIELRRYIPNYFNNYYEPFLGSGALFFDISPNKAIISDINSDLINCYMIVKNKVDELIENLKKHINSADYFYKMRGKNLTKLSAVEKASRFIYLNRTCFNGLYRENKKGQFNVPFGRYQNPKIVQEESLIKASMLLKKARILKSHYKDVLKNAKKGDLIYLDPPYFPLGGYSDFKRYHKVFFEQKDHEELSDVFEELDRKGCFIILSNSDTTFTRNLYSRWRIHVVMAKRLINCDASRRGKVTEILVTNYEPTLSI